MSESDKRPLDNADNPPEKKQKVDENKDECPASPSYNPYEQKKFVSSCPTSPSYQPNNNEPDVPYSPTYIPSGITNKLSNAQYTSTYNITTNNNNHNNNHNHNNNGHSMQQQVMYPPISEHEHKSYPRLDFNQPVRTNPFRRSNAFMNAYPATNAESKSLNDSERKPNLHDLKKIWNVDQLSLYSATPLTDVPVFILYSNYTVYRDVYKTFIHTPILPVDIGWLYDTMLITLRNVLFYDAETSNSQYNRSAFFETYVNTLKHHNVLKTIYRIQNLARYKYNKASILLYGFNTRDMGNPRSFVSKLFGDKTHSENFLISSCGDIKVRNTTFIDQTIKYESIHELLQYIVTTLQSQ